MSDTKFAKGCEVFAEAAIRAGCRFFAGYPITPQSEILEYMAKNMYDRGGAFVQSESELAAINMVYGASCMGIRAMTSSSSPGISLKTEGISYLAAACLPAVIVSVQRGGPGLGTINCSQPDYFQATKAPGHGGHKCMVFAPSTLQEVADIMQIAFEKAERDLNPVIVLSDGCMSSMMETVTFREPLADPLPRHSRSLWNYDPNRNNKIRAGAADPATWEAHLLERAKIYERWQEEDVMVDTGDLEDAKIVLTGYGSSGRLCRTVVKKLRAENLPVGFIKPITVVPFPKDSFKALDPKVTRIVVAAEMAVPGQMIEDVRISTSQEIEVLPFARTGGVIPSPGELEAYVRKLLEKVGEN